MVLWEDITQQLEARFGGSLRAFRPVPVGGGSINETYRLEGEDQAFFVKLNQATKLEMFEAEAEGLQALHQTATLRVPEPLLWGTSDVQAYLVLEYLSVGGAGSAAQLGEGLAALHRHTDDRFGWHRDNTIGSTPQRNTRDKNWVAFWAEQRLGFQLNLALEAGADRELESIGGELIEWLPAFMDGREPEASLLHGDLWSGNYAFTQEGEPAIFDPAVYYGDRETDVAMTELFGGFGADFYAAYRNDWPLDSGYATRKTLYNLYHVLNHYNLFGGSYLSQAQGMIGRLLSEVR
ncbi:Ribulosamine/erythrulosamine 3-kinase potentially involved in protein deglycation [hydrothermal vent metagenome]|uniref:Ribulosamine/erythrulosamine 3-kinase potentially involved in protein deglycation n=1 Tax=hydrothermal vent metagenome TaxID=652676 RepID=A0A3B0YD75_9ZZZZ